MAISKQDLKALLKVLGTIPITSVMVEGGATLIGSLVREKLVDKFLIFKAHKILGGNDGVPMAYGRGPAYMDQCLSLKNVRFRKFEGDVLISGYPDYT